ncbi:MAG: hypothetical protein QOH88_2100 [Verrucomicrobiota bacterium]|jgi:hypothetical protein
MWKSLLASLLLTTAALAQENPSAYEALRVVGTTLNREMMSRVVSVSGVDGAPQPRTWKIVIDDRRSGGLHEYTVEDNRIASQRVPNRSVTGSTQGATINTARLNLDSTGAYSVASHTAETSHVTFSFVSYTLRTDDRGNPTWIITLEDRSRKPLGTIHIKANDGRVTRVEGMYQGRNMDQVEEDTGTHADNPEVDPGDDPEDNIVKRNVKRLFRKTRDEAHHIFERTKRSFKDFVNRW